MFFSRRIENLEKIRNPFKTSGVKQNQIYNKLFERLSELCNYELETTSVWWSESFFRKFDRFPKNGNPKKQAASIGDDIKIYEKRPKKSRN